MAETGRRYAAFISYRHAPDDRRWAQWLHNALETFRVPKRLARDKGLPQRLGRVFRDEEELPASADLSDEINVALEASQFLIVVCTLRTPHSEWVNREIERFRELGRHDQILALLVDGEPREDFPRALVQIRQTITDGRGLTREQIEATEPLAADVRERPGESQRRLKRLARLRIASCLLGVPFDDLRQRDRERRMRRSLLSLAVAAIVLLPLVLAALLSVRTAREQAHQAERLNAERRKRMSEVVAIEPGSVSAFTLAAHPSFGSSLEKRNGRPFDRTQLKFNHRHHVLEQKLSCWMCHTTGTEPLPAREPDQPPFASSTSATDRFSSVSPGYMQPVSYDRHCSSCHPLVARTGRSGPSVRLQHAGMDLVRSQVYGSVLGPSAADRYAAGPPDASPPGRGKAVNRGPADEGEWLRSELEKVNTALVYAFKSCAACHEMKFASPAVAGSLVPAQPRMHMLLSTWNIDIAQTHLTSAPSRRPKLYSKPQTRPQVEEPERQPQAGPAAPSLRQRPRQPIKPIQLQDIEPTGMPKVPRRWYPKAYFDHDAHRSMTCVDCHSELACLEDIDSLSDGSEKAQRVYESQETSEVLVPDIQWMGYQTQGAPGASSHTSASRSCVDCHADTTRTAKPASAECQTCHVLK